MNGTPKRLCRFSIKGKNMTTQMMTNDILESVSLSDLELPIPASPMMEYQETVKKMNGNTLTVGYLADDMDCMNPLEDSCGLGAIYSSHRHLSSHQEMQEALGLDDGWSPDHGLIDDHPESLRAAWIEAAKKHIEFQVWADETAGPTARLNDAYYKYRATKLWRETDGESIYNEHCIDDFDFTDDVRDELWAELRSAGKIGNPNAVILDCYDHGGQVWSLAGHGMQCRWDTSSGAGVWVPDDVAEEEIKSRALIYAFGLIQDNGSWTRSSGKKQFYAVLNVLYGGEKSPHFKQWHEAYEWLKLKTSKLKLPRRKSDKEALLAIGRRRAAGEIAEGVLETYNDWLRGATFGIVMATFNNVGTKDDPDWQFVESDDCWGFIGDEWAVDYLKSEMGLTNQQAA
jgi:hypothetical protein